MKMSLTVLTWYNERLASCLQVDDNFLSNLVECNLISSEAVNSLKEKYFYDTKRALFTQKLLIEIDRKKNATRNLHLFLKENECDSAAGILFREPDEGEVFSKEQIDSYSDELQKCNDDELQECNDDESQEGNDEKSVTTEDSNLLTQSNRKCL